MLHARDKIGCKKKLFHRIGPVVLQWPPDQEWGSISAQSFAKTGVLHVNSGLYTSQLAMSTMTTIQGIRKYTQGGFIRCAPSATSISGGKKKDCAELLQRNYAKGEASLFSLVICIRMP